MTRPPSTPQAELREEDDVTDMEYPDTIVHSQWGCITHDEWIGREMARMRRHDPRPLYVRENGGGTLAINRPGTCPVRPPRKRRARRARRRKSFSSI